MSKSALYGIVIYCVGCVIPTPLEQAQGDTHYSPVFVTSSVTPRFGKINVPELSQFPLNLAADDPNADDTLEVRLFLPGPSGGDSLLYTGFNETLKPQTPPDPDRPTLRLGSIEPVLCGPGTAGQTYDLTAIVADRIFKMNTSEVPGGLSDTNHWELTCTPASM